MSGPVEPLQAYYERHRTSCDKAAVKHKKIYQIIWFVATIASWITLLLAIIVLALPDIGEFYRVFLKWIVPLSSIVVITATLIQFFLSFRNRWRNYRRAAEELRTECMLYKVAAKPYEDEDAESKFRDKIEAITSAAASGQACHFVRRPRVGGNWLARLLRMLVDYFRLIILPKEFANELPHSPDLSDSTSRLTDFDRREEAVVIGRIKSQQRWHLRKARKYFWWFAIFEIAILLIAVVYGLSTRVPEPRIWVVAELTAFTLFLYAVRDFLDFPSTVQRYLWVVSCLQDVLDDYGAEAGPFDGLDRDQRLRLLVEQSERILSLECQYWYASVS